MLEPPRGGGSGGCARGPNTSGRPSQWPWQNRCTTQLQGDRRLPGPECGQESLRTLGRGGRRSTSWTLPTGTEASVSWGAVAGHAAPGWSGDGGVGRLHFRLPHTGCPGGEEEGRGGEGVEGEGEGGAEEAAEAAGTGTGVLGAPGHPCRAPFGPVGCQAHRACGA